MDVPDRGENRLSVADGDTHAGVDDPLLASLRYVAGRFALPYTDDTVVGGLPLVDARLTVDLFPRAAERLGLDAKLMQRKLAKIPALVAPFIILMRNSGAGVVIDKDDTTVTLVLPLVSDQPKVFELAELAEEETGHVFYITQAARRGPGEALSETGDRASWFWKSVRRFWPSWLQIVAAALLINLLGLAMPLFIMNVYDRVIPNLAIPTLWALASGVVVALVFDFILREVRTLILDRTGQRVDMKIASGLFEHALAIAMPHRPPSAGGIANQIREFESVRDFFTSSGIVAATDLLFIGVFIAVLMMIVGPIAYVPLVAVPIVIVVTLLVQMPLSRAVRATQEQATRRHSILIESLVGIESLKAAGGEGVMQAQWEHAVAATARANAASRFWSSTAVTFTGMIQQAVSVIIIVWGVFLIGDGAITVGGLIAANILAGRVLAPLGNIAVTIARAQQAFTAMRSISALMALPQERDGAVARGLTVRGGAIEFRDVTFAYPGASMEALRDVSFTVAPGERVGIVGRVGSGKTTLGKLIAGFYPPDTGSILVDEREVRGYDPAALRRGVGYVGQDPELFVGTLRDNIVLGDPSADEDAIATAARTAGVDGFAAHHPLGLDMPVGERGRGLSGGQRHAVALARIMLRKPTILFLDEPSGAMDSTTEAELIERIGAAASDGETLMICSHRSSFLSLVDRLIVMDRGRILADGPRDKVLASLEKNAGAKGRKR